MSIKLRDGFMWRNYCGFYTAFDDDGHIPSPGGVCNYFWTSVFGGAKRAIAAALRLFDKFTVAQCVGWITAITCVLAGLIYFDRPLFSSAIVTAVAFMAYCCAYCFFFQTAKKVDNLPASLGIPAFALSLVMLSLPVAYALAFGPDQPEGRPGPVAFLWLANALGTIFLAMMILLGSAFGVITGLGYLAGSETGRITGLYVKALKDRVCPMVTPPEGWTVVHGTVKPEGKPEAAS